MTQIEDLETRIAVLERRVDELDAPPHGALPPPSDVAARPLRVEAAPPRARRATAPDVARPATAPSVTRPAPAKDAARLEELLGGRVLAWVGALAVLTGLFLLLVIAVSRGWIGEEERTVMAGAASLALLFAGVRLHERRGRTEASLAAAATGIAGLFATWTVAGAVYDLVPDLLAFAGAIATGAAATALALRWEARGIAALGIVGALFSPALLGAAGDGAGVAMLAVATAAATAVVVWQRWTWLACAALGIATPQWLGWLLSTDPAPLAGLAALVVFGALGAAAAVGFDVRVQVPRLRISSALLLTFNALVLASAGWFALSTTTSHTAGHVWLAALAAAHLGGGIAARRRLSHELALAALGVGLALANIAYASVVDGLPLLAGYAISAVGFAALLRRDRDETFAAAGLGGQLLLELGHAMLLDAPVSTVPGGVAGPAPLLALALVAAGCGVSARVVDDHRQWRELLDIVGMALLAYLTAVALDGVALAAALAAQAVAFGALARRTRDGIAAAGALGFLTLAAAYALGAFAMPDALVGGLGSPLQAALAIGAVIGATAALAVMAPAPARAALAAAAAIGALYLASVELVTPFQPGLDGLAIGELSVREQGQALLSALWGLTGFATLIAGLLADRPALRRAALGLLGVTIAKVFLYDLAALSSIYRVASFIVLGLLLLAGAFAWQRVRPRALPDLRAVPQGLR
jgi:uncharacterized membrane protein